MTAAGHATDDHAVYRMHLWQRISESLFITACSIDEYAEEKRTEHNLIPRRSKSEAEVTNNKRLRSRYRILLKLITDKHQTSRSLSATAELLIAAYDRTSWEIFLTLSLTRTHDPIRSTRRDPDPNRSTYGSKEKAYDPGRRGFAQGMVAVPLTIYT